MTIGKTAKVTMCLIRGLYCFRSNMLQAVLVVLAAAATTTVAAVVVAAAAAVVVVYFSNLVNMHRKSSNPLLVWKYIHVSLPSHSGCNLYNVLQRKDARYNTYT